MKVEIIQPTEELKRIIKSYTIVETTHSMETTVLPHLGLVIAVQCKGNVLLCNDGKSETISPLIISGMRKSYRRFSYSENTSNILILFTETGAFSLLGKTIFELFGKMESLANFTKSFLVSELQKQIISAQNNQERIELIENYLIANIKKTKSDDLILDAISEIHTTGGLKKITDLSRQFNISPDAFEKRFRNLVGSSPKQFSTIVKMKSIVENQKMNISLTELAHKHEFYDQAHFTKQFKDFSGKTPKDFFKTPYNW